VQRNKEINVSSNIAIFIQKDDMYIITEAENTCYIRKQQKHVYYCVRKCIL